MMNKCKIFLVCFLFTMGCQHRVQVKNAPPSLSEKIGRPIYFSFGSWVLSPEEENHLSEKANLLKSNPSAMVILEGYTDAIGDEGNNLELGDRRARYVKWKLSSEGVDPDHLIVTSFGESQPLSTSLEEDSRKAERRVEFKVK